MRDYEEAIKNYVTKSERNEKLSFDVPSQLKLYFKNTKNT